MQFLSANITGESWSGLTCQPCFCNRPCHFLAGGGNLKSGEVLQQGSLVYKLRSKLCGFARFLCLCVMSLLSSFTVKSTFFYQVQRNTFKSRNNKQILLNKINEYQIFHHIDSFEFNFS